MNDIGNMVLENYLSSVPNMAYHRIGISSDEVNIKNSKDRKIKLFSSFAPTIYLIEQKCGYARISK